jgi:hypothetical protein
VWAPERPGTVKFTKRVYGVVYEIFDVANSWLLHRVNISLSKGIERAERRIARKAGRPKVQPSGRQNPQVP